MIAPEPFCTALAAGERMRIVLRHLLVCTLAACGSDAASSPTTPVEPVVAVASVALSQGAITIGSTGTAQLIATAKDAAGTTLVDRTPAWSSSNTSVATVAANGTVTAIAKGSATITATVEGRTASVPLTVLDVVSIPLFQRPFANDYLMSNFMDHDVPMEFVDANGRFTTFWGEAHANTGRMIDGHSGYDWTMPVGTPLLAVAAGTVRNAATSNLPFYCPLLKKDVSDMMSVSIEHALPGGGSVVSLYLHLSRVDVVAGQAVAAGAQIGLSGNTGCSTGPHLHFETYRLPAQSRSGKATPIDPFGWASSSPDPWDVHAEGAQSVHLWKAGEAPPLRRGGSFSPGASPFQALVTQLVSEGVRDDVNPNNEYVELSLNPAVSAASLDGYQIRGDKSGVSYALPKGITLTATQPRVRIYTGPGTNSATTLYMGRPSGIWTNTLSDDCLRMVTAAGTQLQVNLGNGCPSASASQALVELPSSADFTPRRLLTPRP